MAMRLRFCFDCYTEYAILFLAHACSKAWVTTIIFVEELPLEE